MNYPFLSCASITWARIFMELFSKRGTLGSKSGTKHIVSSFMRRYQKWQDHQNTFRTPKKGVFIFFVSKKIKTQKKCLTFSIDKNLFKDTNKTHF